MKIQIEAQGLNQVSSVLESMALRGISLRPLMAELGTALIASVHENFAQQGRPDRWKARSPLTEKIYSQEATHQVSNTKRYQNAKMSATKARYVQQAIDKRLGANSKILMQSGALRNSIMLGRVTNTEIEIGSSLVYARIHQLGGTITPKKAKSLYVGGLHLKKVTIPARSYLVVVPEDIAILAGLTMNYIREGKV